MNGNIHIESSTLDGFNQGALTNSGSVIVDNGNTLYVLGTLNNNGSIVLGQGGGSSNLYLSGNTLLTGSGTLTMSNSSEIYGVGGAMLENASTIQGAGYIGTSYGISVQNDAGKVINTNVNGGTLIIDPASGVINNGTLEATNGGLLELYSYSVNNASGTISTDSNPNSEALLYATLVQGGTLNGNIHVQGATLDGSTYGALNIAGTLTVDNGNNGYFLGTLNNTGSIVLGQGGGSSNFYLSGNVTLTGGGTLTLNNSSLIYAASGTTLENANGTIQGAGYIGDTYAMSLKNDVGQVINANVNGKTLVVDPYNGTTNQGTMEATNGGTLGFYYYNVNNNGGTIATDSGNGSEVLLYGGTIQGGTLNGNVHVQNSTTLDGTTYGALTNAGTLTVDNGNVAYTVGTLNNTGSIVLAHGGGSSYMYLSGSTTLTGGGTLTLNNSSIIYGAGGATLENANGTIQGAGYIGDTYGIALKNDAGQVINANVNGQTLIVDPSSGTINQGTMQATNGGTLAFYYYNVNNNGGTITTDSGNGSEVLLYGGTIQGGTLNGNVHVQNSTTLDGMNQGVLTNLGTITVDNGNTVFPVGTINNQGAIVLGQGGGSSNMYLGSNVTLTGSGTLTLSNSSLIYGTGGATLENVSNTIQGQGYIGDTYGINVTNDVGGTIKANVPGGTLHIDPAGTFINAGTLRADAGSVLIQDYGTLSSTTFSGNTLLTGTYVMNSGTIQLNGFGNNAGGEIVNNQANIFLNGPNSSTHFLDAGGHEVLQPLANNSGSLTVMGGYAFTSQGDLANSGSVTVGSGSSITAGSGGANNYNQSAGSTQVDGTLTATNVNVNGGTLLGTGTVHGSTTVASGAYLMPGDSMTSPGTLSLDTLTLNGTLNEVLTLSGFGVTNVSGALVLNGGSSILNLLQAGNYNPAAGTTLIIMTAGTPVSGSFGAFLNQYFNAGSEYWNVLYNQGGNNVELVAANVNNNIISTWSGPSNNWTTLGAFDCVPGPTPCTPNNSGGNTYSVVLNSAGNQLNLDSGSNPTTIAVTSVDVAAGTLWLGTGATLDVAGSFTDADTLKMQGGTLYMQGALDVLSGGNIHGYGTITGPGSLTNAGAIYGGHTAGGLDLSGINITNYDSTTKTLTGGLWQAGVSNPGTLILPGDIVTNSAFLVLQNAGSQILDAGHSNALAGLTSNQGGALTLFNGATLTTTGSFTNNNNSALNASFGGSALTITGDLANSNNSLVNVNGSGGGASITVTGNLSNDATSTVQTQNGGVLSVTGSFTNQGTLSLMSSGDVVSAGSLNNSGVVNVAAGATLNDTLTNSGTINLNGTQNVAGSFSNLNPGVINVNGGGAMNVDASAGFSANTNTGTINLAGSLNFSDSGAGNGANILGGGAINLNGGSINATSDMFLVTDSAITGNGSISGPQFVSTGSITPVGTITISPNAQGFTLDGYGTVNTGDTLAVMGSGGSGSTTVGGQGYGQLVVNGGTFTGQSFVTAGYNGTGLIEVLNGGSASATSLTLGFNPGAVGELVLAYGGAQMNLSSFVAVGDSGAGYLYIYSGSQLSSAAGVIAANTGSYGVAYLNGSGAEWNTNGGDLSVGSNGYLQVTGGALMTTSGGNIDNAGGVYLSSGGTISGNNYTQSGGYTTVDSGGTLSVSGDVTQNGGTVDILAGGTIDPNNYYVNGGTLTVDGSLIASTVTVGTGGTLNGGGSITGDLISDGVLAPTGTLSLSGNLTLGSNSILMADIFGLGNYGRLLSGGDATLDGTLDILLMNGYIPNIGDIFFIDSALADFGGFGTVNGLSINSNEQFDVIYNASNVELCVVSTPGGVCGQTAPTPEPSSVLLFAGIALAAGWYARKRYQKRYSV